MRAHPSAADSDRMPANHRAIGDREPPGYEIRVRGPIGPTMMQAFPTLALSRSGQDTLLTGSLPDHSALYGVIHQLEALGLELLEIRCQQTVPRSTAREGARGQQATRNSNERS
jgi:hypothetical protein